MNINFNDQLAHDRRRVEHVLDGILKSGNPLDEAMRHAVMNGGKRLRAHLVYETGRICGLDESVADFGAAAIELMHAYSLVHDDLPSMDDDDLRRGQPTVHVKWNEWTAILAGDALQALAFETLSGAPLEAERIVALVRSLGGAAGRHGMVLGQFLDLDAETRHLALSLEDIRHLHENKTGALIAWSAEFGARASARELGAFRDYGLHLGLAFQIWDDVLDHSSDSETLGKTAGKDEAVGKATYVSLLGLERARTMAEEQVQSAKSALLGIESTENLLQLADFVITRPY